MSRTYQFANVHILFIYVCKGMCMGMDVTVVVGGVWNFIYHFLATFGMGLIQVR